MNSTSPMSPNPGGRADNSLLCMTTTRTDIQETNNSSHSQNNDHNQSTSLSTTSILSPISHHESVGDNRSQQQYNSGKHDSNQRRNLKTEYKSNFTPFDQYVYNEITDTFVKQSHCKQTASNNLLVESRNTRPLSASNSNQDLSLRADRDQLLSMSAASPVLESGAFEPVNGAEHHHDVTSEPWYMEVMKRNEKAHEYRYKSEIGHNSPLLKNAGPSNEDLIRKSPLNNDALTSAQTYDQQQLTAGVSDSVTSKQTFKFSPHDYKRDHMIAHMANNNNFKLPKDSSKEPAGRAPVTRRAPPAAIGTGPSARPLARSTAASRARSQSSRRPVTGAATASTPKAEPTTKSNQTTPTRSVPSRVSTRPMARANPTAPTTTSMSSTTRASRPSTTVTKPATKTTLGSTQNGTSRPTTAAPARRPLTSTTASKVASSRASPVTATSSSSKATASTTRVANARSNASAASRTVTAAAAAPKSASTGAPKSPVKRVGITGTTARPPAARQTVSNTSRLTTKAPPAKAPVSSSDASSNAVKSIRAGQKAAAIATSANAALTSSDSEPKPLAPNDSQKEELQEQVIAPTRANDVMAIPIQPTNYMTSEPDLIFTTTEAGNMLADEIAQAERAASENLLREQASQQVDKIGIQALYDAPIDDSKDSQPEALADLETQATPDVYMISDAHDAAGTQTATEPQADRNPDIDSEAQAALEPQATYEPLATLETQPSEHVTNRLAELTTDDENQLVNGLAGGLVSAEDRYDSSDRDASSDFTVQQTSGQANNISQANEDEPYSIIQTTDDIGKQDQQSVPISSDKDQQSVVDSTVDLQGANVEPHDEHMSEHKEANLIDDSELADAATNFMATQREVSSQSNLERSETDDINPVQSSDLQEESPKSSIESEHEILSQKTDEVNREALLTDDQNLRKRSTSGDNEDIPMINSGLPKPEAHLSDENDSELAESPRPLQNISEVQLDKNLSSNDLTAENDIERPVTVASPLHEDSHMKDGEGESERIRSEEDATIKESNNDKLDQVEATQNHTPSDDNDIISDVMGMESREMESKQDQLLYEGQIDKQVGDAREAIETLSIEQGIEAAEIEDDHVQQIHQHAGSVKAHQDEQVTPSVSDNAPREAHFSDSEDDSKAESRDSKSELLMNVADLMEIETIKKQEMAKKAEAEREKSSSRGSLNMLQAGEILLSADQLNEQFAQLAEDKTTTNDSVIVEKQSEQAIPKVDAERVADDLKYDTSANNVEQEGIPALSGSVHSIQDPTFAGDDNASPHLGGSDDLLNFGSITPTNELKESDVRPKIDFEGSSVDDESGQRFDTFEVEQASSRQKFDAPEIAEISDSIKEPAIDQEEKPELLDLVSAEVDSTRATKSTASVDDEDDLDEDEEHQKLSNNLTNSDDDVIIEPRNKRESVNDESSNNSANISPSRYNEGAGLSLLAQKDRLDDLASAELADGSSAEIVAPTMAENRVEVATSKSVMPELSQAASFIQPPKLTQDDDYDSGDDIDLNPNADLLDVAATMSPSSSVAEQMLKLSRQASDGGATSIDMLDNMAIEDQKKTISRADVLESSKPDDDRNAEQQHQDVWGRSELSTSDVVLADSLRSSSSESLSSKGDLTQWTSDNKPIESKGDAELTFIAPSLVEAAHNVEPINNNEIDSDRNSGSRKQSINRNGDSEGKAETVQIAQSNHGPVDEPVAAIRLDQEKTMEGPKDDLDTANVTLSTN